MWWDRSGSSIALTTMPPMSVATEFTSIAMRKVTIAFHDGEDQTYVGEFVSVVFNGAGVSITTTPPYRRVSFGVGSYAYVEETVLPEEGEDGNADQPG